MNGAHPHSFLMPEVSCCEMDPESMYSKNRKLSARERLCEFRAQEVRQQDASRQQ